jgi:hypothetical protein
LYGLAKSGYRALSKNIPEFAKINEMPIPLDIRRIAEGDGIGAAFIKKKKRGKIS